MQLIFDQNNDVYCLKLPLYPQEHKLVRQLTP